MNDVSANPVRLAQAMEEPIDVVLKFSAAVCSLLTADCILVDSLGNRVEGADKMRAPWEGYLGTGSHHGPIPHRPTAPF